jgi:hypothetical protein
MTRRSAFPRNAVALEDFQLPYRPISRESFSLPQFAAPQTAARIMV